MEERPGNPHVDQRGVLKDQPLALRRCVVVVSKPGYVRGSDFTDTRVRPLKEAAVPAYEGRGRKSRAPYTSYRLYREGC